MGKILEHLFGSWYRTSDMELERSWEEDLVLFKELLALVKFFF